MNDSTIVLAGATGNLGGRIAGAQLARGTTVRTLVRRSAGPEKLELLRKLGATVAVVNFSSVSELTAPFSGASCVGGVHPDAGH